MPRMRFADFLDANEPLTIVDLADRAGLEVTFVSGLINDRIDPMLSDMIAVTRAASAILNRKVRVTELFDLGDGEQ